MLAPRRSLKEDVSEVLAVLRLTDGDVNSENILEFLQRFVQMEIHKWTMLLECLSFAGYYNDLPMMRLTFPPT